MPPSPNAGYVNEAGVMSSSLRAVARAADTYGIELERLHGVWDTLDGVRRSFNEQVQALAAGIAGDWSPDLVQVVSAELFAARSAFLGDVTTLASDVGANDMAMRTAVGANRSLEWASSGFGHYSEDPADEAMTRPGAPGPSSTPEDVARWWEGLSEDERFAVTAANPEIIGSADGLPAEARDQANRSLLASDLATWEMRKAQGRLSPEEDTALGHANAASAALENIVVDPVTGERVTPLLHVYDPLAFGGDGAVAISYGNPDTADNVAALVPGTTIKGSDIAGFGAEHPGYADFAENIYSSARVADPTASVAAIVWIGYDTPEFDETVATEDMAKAGGDRLADYMEGLDAARTGEPAHTTVIGHSYGSTTVGHAATTSGQGLEVEEIVFVGSPGVGSGVDHAEDLGGARVWAGNASRDLVARLADNGWWNSDSAGDFASGGGAGPLVVEEIDLGMGDDVGDEDFGALRFEAEAVDRADSTEAPDHHLTGAFEGTSLDDHSKYFIDGSESLTNIGRIVAGKPDDVELAGHTYDPLLDGVQDPEFDRQPEAQPTVVVVPGY